MAKKSNRKKKKRSAKSSRQPSKKKTRVARRKSSGWQQVDRLQLAQLIGVHPDTVSDYTRSGMPVIMRGGAGRRSVYDAVECLAWWRSNQGQDRKEAAQTRAYEAQAQLNELKIAIQKGELLPRDQVILAGQNYTKAWTAKIRALPRQMVQAGLIVRDRERDVTAMLHALLSEISRWESAEDVTRNKG